MPPRYNFLEMLANNQRTMLQMAGLDEETKRRVAQESQFQRDREQAETASVMEALAKMEPSARPAAIQALGTHLSPDQQARITAWASATPEALASIGARATRQGYEAMSPEDRARLGRSSAFQAFSGQTEGAAAKDALTAVALAPGSPYYTDAARLAATGEGPREGMTTDYWRRNPGQFGQATRIGAQVEASPYQNATLALQRSANELGWAGFRHGVEMDAEKAGMDIANLRAKFLLKGAGAMDEGDRIQAMNARTSLYRAYSDKNTPDNVRQQIARDLQYLDQMLGYGASPMAQEQPGLLQRMGNWMFERGQAPQPTPGYSPVPPTATGMQTGPVNFGSPPQASAAPVPSPVQQIAQPRPQRPTAQAQPQVKPTPPIQSLAQVQDPRKLATQLQTLATEMANLTPQIRAQSPWMANRYAQLLQQAVQLKAALGGNIQGFKTAYGIDIPDIPELR